MHASVSAFIEETVKPGEVKNKRVLEVGSYDVNGSIRPHIETLSPKQYMGVDLRRGSSVDRIVDCEHLVAEMGTDWDLVLNCEMLEHVRDWRACCAQLASVVKVGGRLIITTRSPGFPYHPEPEDHWRYTVDGMYAIMVALGMSSIKVEPDPQYMGVFASAYKDQGWRSVTAAVLADIDVDMVDVPESLLIPKSNDRDTINSWCTSNPPMSASTVTLSTYAK